MLRERLQAGLVLREISPRTKPTPHCWTKYIKVGDEALFIVRAQFACALSFHFIFSGIMP